jgi:hypothetical protein
LGPGLRTPKWRARLDDGRRWLAAAYPEALRGVTGSAVAHGERRGGVPVELFADVGFVGQMEEMLPSNTACAR